MSRAGRSDGRTRVSGRCLRCACRCADGGLSGEQQLTRPNNSSSNGNNNRKQGVVVVVRDSKQQQRGALGARGCYYQVWARERRSPGQKVGGNACC
jgi:hypothetical protein